MNILESLSAKVKFLKERSQRLGRARTVVVKLVKTSADIRPAISIIFPDKCVYCCADPDTHVESVNRPNGWCKLDIDIKVPFCSTHANIQKGNCENITPQEESHRLTSTPIDVASYSEEIGGFGWLITTSCE